MDIPPVKRLRKSRDRKLFGVCGGLAEYFGIDPTVVRLIWGLATVLTAAFPGTVIYLICALAMPGPDGE